MKINILPKIKYKECINLNCINQSEMFWCSVKCKEDFYLEYYAGSELVKMLERYKKKSNKAKIEYRKEFYKWQKKNKTKGFCEYILKNEK